MKKISNRTFAIARKEFLHIIHDPRSLLIIIVMPLMQLTLFGYALNLEIKNVDLDPAMSTITEFPAPPKKERTSFSVELLEEPTSSFAPR